MQPREGQQTKEQYLEKQRTCSAIFKRINLQSCLRKYRFDGRKNVQESVQLNVSTTLVF